MKSRRGPWDFFFALLCTVGCVAILRDTYYNGWDFEVFWNAARAILHGESPYTFGIENGWSYKYPPWAAWVFLPFGLIDLGTAKILWGISQILCVAWTYVWLLRVGIRRSIVRGTLCAFWFVIHYHALSGQVTLLTLALGTLAHDGLMREARPGGVRYLRVFAIAWAFSIKVFSAVTLLGLWDRKASKKAVSFAVGLLALSMAPQFLMTHQSPAQSFKQWRSAASTSATSEDTVVRLWNNQGIPGALGRIFGVDAKAIGFDLAAALLVMVVLSVLWGRATQNRSFELRWSGWLAIGVVAHPLVWFQSFVLIWPLACFALQAARDSEHGKNDRLVGLALFGIACTTLITKSGAAWFGLEEFVLGLEMLSIKSIGTLILLYTAATGSIRAKAGT